MPKRHFRRQYNLVAVVVVVASLSGMKLCFFVVIMVVALASTGSQAHSEDEQR